MSTILSHWFNQTAYDVTVTTNGTGDRVYGAVTSFPCRFRENRTFETSNNLENSTADAMLWWDVATKKNEGDIVKVYDKYYQITRLIPARRPQSGQVVFNKAELERYHDAD